MFAPPDPEMETLLELLAALEDFEEAARRYDARQAEIDAAADLDAIEAIEQALLRAGNVRP
jgi:hypothetical protein